MSKKQLLLESCDFSFACNLSEEEKNTLTESLRISAGKNGNLIVKNIPCTILDRRNQNGRTYSTELMQRAIEEARPKMKAKMLLCSGDEHPSDSTFPRPSSVSHCVINAYIKNVEIEVEGKKERHNVLFNDWEILNERSQIGAQVQQLILSGFSVGTSIRSIGSCDPDGNVTELEYLGTDIVGQPSSSTFVNMPINESVKVSAAPLNETFIVSASATNVVHDLDSALVLQSEIDNANFGTVKKTSTKLDSEIDPKTGAETTMVTLETETEDEVTDIDQALAMAKQAIMNGKADIDSVTIENVKEEQPKESAESSDAPVLNEDDADDTERTAKCAWCGDVLPMSDLKKEKDLGYVCNHCAKGLESREGSLDFEESDDENDPVYKALDKSNYYAFKEPEEYIEFISANKNFLGDYDFSEAEQILNDYKVGTLNKALARHKLEPFVSIIRHNYQAHNFEECEYVPESAMKEDGNENPYVLLGKICQNSTEDSWIQKKARQMANSFEHGEIDQPTFIARLNDMILANDFKLPESKMTEAKEEKVEDPTEGQKYVLKTEQGFVAMDGNAIKFVEQPKDAIHFVKGKEESGVVHLSGINKILDTMGIYDVEKYYKKGTTDISASDDVNVQVTEEENKDVKEGLIMGDGGVVTKPNEITGMPIKEDNGSNTRFNATVEIQGTNGTSSENIPVSAVEMEGINNEVGNLYNMKSQKADGQVKITVTDTTSGEQFIYNPESQSVEPAQMQQESAGDIEQDGNKVSVEIDDKNTVEKEFENPAQASVVKAGLEQGKLSGDVLMSEDGERPQYQDAPDYSEENIQPGWYAASKDPNIIGIIGPFDSKEELLAGMDKVKDQINIRYVSPEEAGIAAESTKIDEVLYDEPTQASDPYIEEPMTDAVEQDIVVSVNNIDWNTDDLINKFMANAEADDPVNFGDIQSKINDLPDNLDIRITKEELPADIDIHALKDMVKNKIAKEYVMNINDLAITDLHSVN